MAKIKSEEEILNAEIRKNIIAETLAPENQSRKGESLKRYEIYKDATRKYVIESLSHELEGATVKEMENRASNVSILRKIINKKARVYKNGAIREVIREGEGEPSESEKEEQGKVDDLYRILKANQNWKKANRYLELHKNSAVQILPLQDEDGKFYLKMRILPGHTYDVVENEQDPEKAMVYILSHFTDRDHHHLNANVLEGGDGRGVTGHHQPDFRQGDNTDQTIADSEADQGIDKRRFVWWTKSFHFTTNEAGQYVDPDTDEPFDIESPDDERIQNDIGRQTIVSLNKDQDGNYWAVGGEDLTEGAILINVLLTDLYFIAKIQGMGIFFAIGPDIPKRIKAGPNQGITIDTKDHEGPSPEVGFASSNPPLQDHMRMVEQYVALLLSTNDLASSTVQGKLDATTAASGIQELIVRSEVTGAIEDEQQIFDDAEPELFEIMRDWQNWLVDQNNEMREDFKEIGNIDPSAKIRVKFLPFQEFLTEEQKLTIIKMRKELGLDTEIDALMRDDTNLTRPQAEQKLQRVLAEKLRRSRMMLGKGDEEEETPPENPDEENEEEETTMQ